MTEKEIMKLIVGLGNSGPKYASVRHNLGFMVVDELVDRLQRTGYSWEKNEKLKSEVLRINYPINKTSYIRESEQILLAKPQTYMNNSGLAVRLLTTYYKLPSTSIIVVHDDLDLPLGKIKVRLGGAAAGHHGVESIINSLGTDQFVRVRLGIGNLRSQSGEHKGQHFNAERFVLEPFMPNEKSKVKHMIKQAIEAVQLLLQKGVTSAQNQFN